MAASSGDDNDRAATRHVWGPRPLGALVPAVTRPAYRRRAPAAAQVLADWASIVGPALAAVTAPRRLTGGTLSIACAGPVAMELQHLSTQLIERINAHLGRVVVERLRFVQDFAAAATPPRPRPSPSPARVQEVERTLGDLPEGPLRDALGRLGRAVVGSR
jgi:hypothetical protein